jgi:hypothetical protein
MLPRLRQATELDLPRISEVRHGTAENRLEDPSLVTPAEVEWYLNEAIFFVSEDDAGIQGFTCANHQTGYVWALFAIDGAQGVATARRSSMKRSRAFGSPGTGRRS